MGIFIPTSNNEPPQSIFTSPTPTGFLTLFSLILQRPHRLAPPRLNLHRKRNMIPNNPQNLRSFSQRLEVIMQQ